MSAPQPPTHEITDQPWRPRFRWMKRGLVGAFVLSLLLGGARLWWGHVTHQRLQRELDAVLARGEPVTLEQYNSPYIPDDENAAILWKQAEMAINSNVNTPAQSNLVYQSYPPWTDEWHQVLETGVAGNAKALALARQARARPKVDWQLWLSTPITNSLLPQLNPARDLANVVGDAALHAHLHGDDFEAIERIADVMRLSKDISEPALVSALVGIGISALAMNRLEMIAPDLKIAPESGVPIQGAATRVQLRAMIDQLLADSESRQRVRSAMVFERLEMIDLTRFSARSAWFTAPMFDMEMLRISETITASLRVADQQNYPAMQRAVPTIPAPNVFLPVVWASPLGTKASSPPSQAIRISRVMTAQMASSYWRFLETEWRINMEMRFGAVVLAVQMYRADHNGEFPARLDVLVPKYLPRVPRDPFSDSGRPISYVIAPRALPDGRDRPLIYSVYKSGDSDVELKYAPPTPQHEWSQGAQFRDLARWSPPAPATAPAE